MRAQLQALHAVVAGGGAVCIATCVLVVVLLLSLSQSSAVEFYITHAAGGGWSDVAVLGRRLSSLRSLVWQWT